MKFPCPNCGDEIFEADSESRAMNDFVGMPCPVCGYRIKAEDIQKQSEEEAVKRTRNTFRKNRSD